jgi:hypothetical protein
MKTSGGDQRVVISPQKERIPQAKGKIGNHKLLVAS